MKEYPKINSIFKRDEQTHRFLDDQWSQPEFEYLQNNEWIFTEKVDGTNIRVYWEPLISPTVTFGGRTDNAQIPTFLYSKLQELFPVGKFQSVFPDTSLCLYGEGYGAKIQKCGGNYNPKGCDFVLFDVLIGEWWLKREDVEDIAGKLGLQTVPVIGKGNIAEAIKVVTGGLKSVWGDFKAEGLVLRPSVELKTRSGQRIITKLKWRDFA